MLNIPDEVKALFSTDVIHKNFHVHFPDGEYRDLNNEDIVSESVAFTESLCSQQYFKFGLAEASQIEFTAVGIPNVRGAYIECAIEIDCTRLGSEWAEENSIDDTLDFLEPQTCTYDGKLYYRVPYGRFKVDTCPRDHGAMAQRKITAYSESVQTNDQMSPHESNSLNTMMPKVNRYSFNIRNFIYGAVGWMDENVFTGTYTGIDTTLSNLTIPSSFTSGIPIKSKETGVTYSLSYKTGYKRIPLGADTNTGSKDAVYSVYCPNVSFQTKDLIDYYSSKYTINGVPCDVYFEYMKTLCIDYWSKASTFPSSSNYAELRQPYDCLYVYRENVRPAQIFVPYYLALSVEEPNLGRVIEPLRIVDLRNDIEANFLFREWQPVASTILDDLKININSTLEQRAAVNDKTKMYSFANAFSFSKYASGFMEIVGWFLKPDRNGALDFFRMSENPTAIPVPRSDWSEFWWDENDIDAIGQVNVIYNDSTENNEQAQQTFDIGDGNSLYVMEDNEVIKNAVIDTDTMQSILDTYFAPNADVINFTPVDLEMRGLPYLETGDYIELTAEDGTTVQTYILNQTISGIQHLTASVASTNGELLKVVDES